MGELIFYPDPELAEGEGTLTLTLQDYSDFVVNVTF